MCRIMTPMPDDASAQVALEIRRGALVLAVLAALREERYGYALRERLAEGGLDVPEGTLYPLLRRLESQGLLTSRWDVGQGRPRRYYAIARDGERVLASAGEEWRRLVAALDSLLGTDPREDPR